MFDTNSPWISPSIGPDAAVALQTPRIGDEQGGWLANILGNGDPNNAGAKNPGAVLQAVLAMFDIAWTAGMAAFTTIGRAVFQHRSTVNQQRRDLEAQVINIIERNRDTVPQELGKAIQQFRDGVGRAASAALDARLVRGHNQALWDRMASALESAGIDTVIPDGLPFDSEHHEAVDHILTDDPTKHLIIASTDLAGYREGEQWIRRPQVVVYRCRTARFGQ
ncbi:nucleotide exchange factor GrpE [Nocardia seriolae]|uniref:Nucleotide exchange factor GrpE n=1 Tax=Nocardia seriolae TaxID=37332 RepID=A0ABC8AT20_9NOCA|nr:nucleotide exchange factor GrpE [Nocardia seriolae]APA97285.1 hypothetical protein NS506_03232 [Nocardia seriolae]MTJ62201.1 nucleotide exchange factor GrpE [Nocardia seriolae]MTJ74570.1 nucleotide exchange factor GrpE [Nocardia seriolae]MTJ87111.1 nucleotide exchange factor GrpE [Nocardia seriolae]MTK31105.1 nucleotide exchange factor GrpE [Nocardia seriolae]